MLTFSRFIPLLSLFGVSALGLIVMVLIGAGAFLSMQARAVPPVEIPRAPIQKQNWQHVPVPQPARDRATDAYVAAQGAISKG